LNADGTVDASFVLGTSALGVHSITVQADAKILVGGDFVALGGQGCTGFGRINSDGTLDVRLDPGEASFTCDVSTVAVQADGKIVVGGSFPHIAWETLPYYGNIERLNADGTLDTSLRYTYTVDSVYSVAAQPDGKVLVGGAFTYICRLNANGTLDSLNSSPNGAVQALALQADGKILVGGYFTTLGGQSCPYLGRLNSDGTVDSSFNTGANGPVFCLAVQADGKILAGGLFTSLGGSPRRCIGRLNADGTVDPSLTVGANWTVSCMALQADGKLLVGGLFTSLGGVNRSYIGRYDSSTAATQCLTFDGSTLTWMRGGSSPEVWRTTFDYSLDGTSWTSLGPGIRIPGGWQLSTPTLPASTTFRARGYTSGSFVETVRKGTLVITNISMAGPELVIQGTGGVSDGTYYLLTSTDASLPPANWSCVATNLFDSYGNFNSWTVVLSRSVVQLS
jgi:uncharacterized delta-60 repeat protein